MISISYILRETQCFLFCGKMSVFITISLLFALPLHCCFSIHADDNVRRKVRSQRKLPLPCGRCIHGYIVHHPQRKPGLPLSVPGLSSENSGKISEMWPFARASLLTLSFSRRRPNTERARQRGFSRLPTHAERLMKQSHLLHVTAPFFLALTWANISYNRQSERKCFERSSRLWKLTSASVGTANTIDLDRSAIERTSQSREDSNCGKFARNFYYLLKIKLRQS